MTWPQKEKQVLVILLTKSLVRAEIRERNKGFSNRVCSEGGAGTHFYVFVSFQNIYDY